MTNADLAKLVERIRGGDQDAFMELYENTYKSVFFHANTILKNKEDAEDVVQEAYTQAYLSLDKLQEPAAVGVWLNRIVSNLSLKKANANARKSAYSLDDEDFFLEPEAGEAALPDEIAERL